MLGVEDAAAAAGAGVPSAALTLLIVAWSVPKDCKSDRMDCISAAVSVEELDDVAVALAELLRRARVSGPK